MQGKDTSMSWFLFINDGNKYFKGGPFATQGDALKIGITQGVEYTVKEYPTRDLARAGSLYRMELLKEGHSLPDISKRHYKIKGA